jgi:hypothetical protein
MTNNSLTQKRSDAEAFNLFISAPLRLCVNSFKTRNKGKPLLHAF